MEAIINAVSSLWPVLLIILIVIAIFLFKQEIKFLLTKGNLKFKKGDVGIEICSTLEDNQNANSDKLDFRDEAEAEMAITSKETSNESEWLDYYNQRDYKKAIEILEDSLKNTNDKDKIIRIEVCIASCIAMVDINKGFEKIEMLINNNPKSILAYEKSCIFYSIYSQYSECIKILDRGVDKLGNHSSLLKLKAEYLTKLNDFEQSEKILEGILEQDSNDIEAYLLFVELYKQQDNYESVISKFEEALKVDPLNIIILSKYARYVYDMNNDEKALILYKRLTKICPRSSEYYSLLGNVYINLNMYNKALEHYEIANELADEKEGWILGNIGNLYNNKGLYNKSIQYLKKAIQINPEDEYANSRLMSAIENRKKEEKIENDFLQNKLI